MVAITIELEGIDAVRRELDAGRLQSVILAAVDRAIRAAADEITDLYVRELRRLAPVRTGELRSSIQALPAVASHLELSIMIEAVFYAHPLNAVGPHRGWIDRARRRAEPRIIETLQRFINIEVAKL